MIITGFLALATQAAAVPPPVAQQTADCARPVYATDMLVCGDPALRARDLRLASMLDAPQRNLPATSPLIEDQEAWFRRSRRCAFEGDQRACVEATYDERLAVLSAPPSGGRDVGSCKPKDGRTGRLWAAGAVFVLRPDGATLAVAFPLSERWRPFLSYSGSERTTTIRDFGGGVVARCRIDAEGMRP